MGIRLTCILGLFLISAFNGIVGCKASASNAPIRNQRLDDVHLRGRRFGLRKIPAKASVYMNERLNRHSNDCTKGCALGIISTFRAGHATPSLLSRGLFVLNQTINIATAALVGSGLVGSWIASILICKFKKLVISAGTFHQKWGLTIASCGFYIIMKCRKIISILGTGNFMNTLLVCNDLIVLLAIWVYSNTVDPVVGGLIGCGYVALELITSFLSSGSVIDMLSELNSFRMASLDEDGNLVKPIEEFKSNNSSREILAQAISSLSLLASSPQYFLSLYLITTTILTFMKQSNHKMIGDSISWLKAGLLDGELRLQSLATRLFAVHASVMVIKGTVASILL